MSELSKFSPQTRVAIYNRVSTEKKVQMEALDVQVAYTRKLVEDNHLTIVDQYIEPETGTEAEHRLEYQRMIRDIKADRIDLVVVKCSDRLCRDQAEWHNFVKLHLQKKFQLYFYLDDHIYDHERDDIKYSVQSRVRSLPRKSEIFTATDRSTPRVPRHCIYADPYTAGIGMWSLSTRTPSVSGGQSTKRKPQNFATPCHWWSRG